MAPRPPYTAETINDYLERGLKVNWDSSGLPSDLGNAPDEMACVTFTGRHLESDPDVCSVFNVAPVTYKMMEEQLRHGDNDRLQ